jgi:hypothetical protein
MQHVPEQFAIDGVAETNVAQTLFACSMGLLVFSLFLSRFLARGAGEALFVVAVSGIMLAGYFPYDGSVHWHFVIAAGLTVLSAMWTFAAGWIERNSKIATPPATDDVTRAAGAPRGRKMRAELAPRRILGFHAAVISALGAAIMILAIPRDDRHHYIVSLSIPMCALSLVALSVLLWRPTAMSASAFLLVSGGVAWMWLDSFFRGQELGGMVRGAFASACAALGAFIAEVLMDWRIRIRWSRTRPRELLQSGHDRSVLHPVLFAICLIVSAMCLVTWRNPWTPAPLAASCIVLFGIAHRANWAVARNLGVAQLAAAIVLTLTAVLPDWPLRPCVALALTGVYFCWLAGFWTQQLHDDTAWTTAGRLIPAARRMAILLAFGAFAGSLSAGLAEFVMYVGPMWFHATALAAVMLLAAPLGVTSIRRRSPDAALASCLCVAAGIYPADLILERLELYVPMEILIAASGLVVAILIGPDRRGDPVDWVYNAVIGGFIPGTLFMMIAHEGAPRIEMFQSKWGLIAATACLLAILIRWWPGAGRRIAAAQTAAPAAPPG